ncbi:MAG: hypothetical protein ACF8NJ_04660 [Phycisphaerales bacterium JB038]
MKCSPSRFLVFLLAGALLAGCLSPRTRGPGPTTPVQLLDLNPVLAPGRTAVLAAALVDGGDEGPLRPPTRLNLLLGDREIPARLYWAWAQLPGAGARASWLDPPLRWQLTLDPPVGGSFASPLIVADIPAGERPQWLQVEGTRVRPIWLEERGELWVQDLRNPTIDPVPWLTVAQAEAEDPTRQWRAALLADRLHSHQQPPRLPDPLPRALADQQTARWRAGFDRLAAADLDLARLLRRRLTGICRAGDTLVPIWPTDEQQLADLLQIQLSPAHDDATRVALSRAWLNAQPRVLAWTETTGEPDAVTVGLANLTNALRTARLRWEDSYEAPQEVKLAAESLRRRTVRFPPDLPAGQLVHTLTVEVGEQVQRLRFPARPTLAQPPGLLLGPFLQPRTLKDWQRGQFAMDAPDRATRASVRRTDVGWELFIECRGEALQPAAEPELLDPRFLRAGDLLGEAVYLFVGPVDRPLAIFAVTPTGGVTVFTGSVATPDVSTARREPVAGLGSAVDSIDSPARAAPDLSTWSATIRIPPQWIDASGLLSLGLIRSYETGAAPTSFPEPLFPWRLEPGRLLIDTSQWDELESMRPL